MAWVVDTCLLIDVAVADPTFVAATRNLLQARLPQGLTICPISYIELAPVFQGDRKAQDEFLFNLGVSSDEAVARGRHECRPCRMASTRRGIAECATL